MLRRWIVGSICILAGSLPLWGEAADSCLTTPTEEVFATYLGTFAREGMVHHESMINLLLNQQEQTYKRKGLIFHFCDTLLQTREDINMEHSCFEYDGMRYDPRQSLFVYALCEHTNTKNVDADYPTRNYKDEFVFQDYITSDFDINELRGIDDEHACSPTQDMQDCMFSTFLPTLFKNIMNIYTNMKLASIYGYKYLTEDMSPEEKEQKLQEAIEDFSVSLFGPAPTATDSPTANECGEAGIRYLSPDEQEGDKAHCSHPRTNTVLKKTIQSAGKLIDDIAVWQADELMAEPCNENDRKQNILACAFARQGHFFAENDWADFQNLYLNELLYLSLFNEYYGGAIVDNLDYSVLSQGSDVVRMQKNQQEYEQLQKEQELHTIATEKTLRMLMQLYVNYPLHIGNLAIMEDIQLYRKAILKPYVPLNQLYYLFRNTQACEA